MKCRVRFTHQQCFFTSRSQVVPGKSIKGGLYGDLKGLTEEIGVIAGALKDDEVLFRVNFVDEEPVGVEVAFPSRRLA